MSLSSARIRLLTRCCLCLVLILGTGCLDGNPSSPNGNRNGTASSTDGKGPRVVAVSYALQQMATALVGSVVDVEYIGGQNGTSNWRPTRADIGRMQTADLIVANGTGATYADWLVTVSLPESKLVESAKRGLSLRDFIAVEDVQIVHSHGPEGEHSHATMVSRTWLDPGVTVKQLDYLAERLKATYPEQATMVDSNLAQIREQLQPLVQRLETVRQRNRPSAEAMPTTVYSATHSLKFLTRAAGINDLHLNWKPDIDEQQIRMSIKEAARERDETTNAQILPVLLIPSSHQRLMSSEFDTVFDELQLKRVLIDLIDTPTDASLLSRIESNIDQIESIGTVKSAESE